MYIIDNLWVRLNELVSDPKCRTFGNDYDLIEWNDARQKPTAQEVQAVDLTNYFIKLSIKEYLERTMFKHDFKLFVFIVEIIDVLLAKGIVVPSDFDLEVKNDYLNIKQKLQDLGIS